MCREAEERMTVPIWNNDDNNRAMSLSLYTLQAVSEKRQE
jgi:hypothetical protein